MTSNSTFLAQAAIKKSLELRMKLGVGLKQPICIYDICETMGISVWFTDIPSMEGFYLPEAQPRPTIVISSLRPSGRRAITCGHELGHHSFGHGEQWDELIETRNETRPYDPHEYQADLFAASLHMPKLAVCHAIYERQIDLQRCGPGPIYALSNWFGVGYATLIVHMRSTLDLLSNYRATDLLRFKPRDIRAELRGAPCPENLIVLDQHWSERPIDLQVGDLLLAPPATTYEGNAIGLVEVTPNQTLIKAQRPGIGRISNFQIGLPVFVRVSRKHYVGRAPYRFDEEVDDE